MVLRGKRKTVFTSYFWGLGAQDRLEVLERGEREGREELLRGGGFEALLEERGFAVDAVGIDVCTRPAKMVGKVDEHFETIQLTYIVGRKL